MAFPNSAKKKVQLPYLTNLSKECANRIELPRSKLTGYQNITMRIYLKSVTPECFNRASSSALAWIPAKSMRK
jgi:hypothetical protein